MRVLFLDRKASAFGNRLKVAEELRSVKFPSFMAGEQVVRAIRWSLAQPSQSAAVSSSNGCPRCWYRGCMVWSEFLSRRIEMELVFKSMSASLIPQTSEARSPCLYARKIIAQSRVDRFRAALSRANVS
jgi:hypothetical protein